MTDETSNLKTPLALALCALLLPLAAAATTYHVSEADGDETNDGITAPVKSITNALAKATAAGDEIVIEKGTYPIAATIAITRNLTIRGATGNPEDVIIKATKTFVPGISLNHANARLSSVVVTDVTGGDHWYAGAGIRILENCAGGTVSNCVVRNCRFNSSAAYGCGGGGIGIGKGASKGFVTHCVVSNCFDDMNCGMALRMYAGTVRNCLFVRNSQLGKATLGTVNISGGTLENCTIADNYAGIGCAGVLASGGTVRNCLIARNATQADTPSFAVWAGTASFFTSCVSDVAAINANCYLTAADPFASADTDDWRPAPGSVPVDRAAVQTWMTGATDLAGNDRVRGTAPDVGCYEIDPTAFAASFRSSCGTQCYTNCAVVFTVSAAPVGASGISCEWDWNGDGTYDETVVGATATHRFAAVGSYRVTARVTDVASGTKALTQSVTYTVLPKTLFVSTAGSATPPYTTPETAANDLQTAYDSAVDGQEIVLMPDTYTYTAAFTVAKGVTVRGATGNPEDVVVRGNGAKHRIFILQHRDAGLASLVVANGLYYGGKTDYGAGVLVTGAGGSVSNCVIRDCRIDGQFGYGGGGIAVDSRAGLVTHSVFSNCWDVGKCFWGNGLPSGGALLLIAGTARNCLFLHNRREITTDTLYGTVRIDSGILENCTFSDNYAGAKCSGVYAKGGTVRNCLIAGNDTDSANVTNAVWAGTASCFTNCISDVAAINDWCILCESPFAAADYGDYRPAPGSAPVNGGATYPWMAGATDIEGNDRIRGVAPDVGCYEIDPDAFAATIAISSGTYGFTTKPVVAVVSTSKGSEGMRCEWDWDGDGVYEETVDGTVGTHVYATHGNYGISARVTDTSTGKSCTTRSYSFPVYPWVIYVSKTGSATPPYADHATAANDLETAYASSVVGQEIAFVPGTYTFTAAVTIAQGVTVRGETGSPEDVVITSDGALHRAFVLNHRDAVLASLVVADSVFSGVKEQLIGAAGAYITGDGGTISNCVFRGCYLKNAFTWGGGGVGMDSIRALLTHTVISNCWDQGPAYWTNGDPAGGALRMKAGTARNCLFVKNRYKVETDDDKPYGTVRIEDGTLENCTLAGNYAGGRCSGVYATGGTVVNCIIAGNDTDSSTASDAVWYGTASCFSRCVTDVAAINDTCLYSEDPYAAFDYGDYRPAPGSVPVNAATTLGWMSGATDLEGNDRIRGAAPDVGCYEIDPDAFSATLKFSSGSYGFANETMLVLVVTANAGEQGIKCEWDWNGDGVYDETTYGTTATHTYATYGNYGISARVTDISSARQYVTRSYAFPVYPRTIYVSATGSATPPYAEHATAANDLQTAYDSTIEGQEIAFVPGTYTFTAAVTIARGVTVRGETGKPEDVVVRGNGKAHRLFILSQRDALLTGLTVSDGFNSEYIGRGGVGIYINLDGGTVSNCVIRNCSNEVYSYHNGGCGVSLDAAYALVTHCVISNCSDVTFQGGRGGAARIWNGCMRNCLIVKNKGGSSADTYGAVRIDGGTLENCTIVENDGGSKCAGVWAVGGNVYNCLIASNRTTSATAAYAVWAGTASCFDHCASDVSAINSDCLYLERPFLHPERGDYRPPLASRAVNGGVYRSWMDGAGDFALKPRVLGRLPDIGCYERLKPGVTVIVK